MSFFFQTVKGVEFKTNLSFKFVLINNKIVIKVPASDGRIMNFIFDSGSNDFLVNNLSVRENNIKIYDQKRIVPLINGSLEGKLFKNINIFKDSLLNRFYQSGALLNLDLLSQNTGMHIDGLIGLNESIKIKLNLNFKDHTLSFSDKLPEHVMNPNFAKFKMFYTDNGNETKFSKYIRRMPAFKACFFINKNYKIETNVLFDTGFNQTFALLSNLNVDSLAYSFAWASRKELNKKTSIGKGRATVYTIDCDSIIIDGFKGNFPKSFYMSSTSDVAISMFGESNWMGLAGVQFMKMYEEIYFDFSKKEIHIKKVK
ncbi:hypothetical protein [Sphingobacterium daejeonense]|uniref:hypothetical protein n=1 Tax=Sphingobacterium daejeonense TaxID=371142 RepID=UPI0010FD22B1|nr:hypothetical protein [Sphingobacterium daejeonense]